MNFFRRIWHRSKIMVKRQRNRESLTSQLLKKKLSKRKLAFLTMDLEHFVYPKKHRDPSYEGLENFLEVINSNKIPTIFFVEGKFALENKKEIISLSDSGHEIGSHGYGHINLGPYVWWNNIRACKIELRKKSITKNHKILMNLTGKPPVSFRAPYFSIDTLTIKIIEKIGYRIDSSLDNVLFGIPTIPYHPSRDDLFKIGDLNIVEFCYTTSLKPSIKSNFDFQKIKFFDKNDFSKNIEIIKNCENISPYIVIPTHPWEFSRKLYKNTNERLDFLSKFLRILKKKHRVKFVKMETILQYTV